MIGERRSAVLRFALLIALAGVLTACGEDDPDEPRVEIVGGGFIFNYRVADAFYGITVRRLRPMESGAILEAEFEDPAGGEPIVVRQPSGGGRLQWMFRTPPLRGIEANRPYRVELRVVDAETGRTLEARARSFRSDVSQEALPDQPLTVGPGYHTNR